MHNCKNCRKNFASKYCPECGTPAEIHRINNQYIIHEVQHGLLHMEKGFLYTLKELFIRPGHAVREFVNGNRAKHYKPIGFVIICSIIYTIITHYFGHQEAIEKLEGNVYKVFNWITGNYQYSNLIEILFISFSLLLLFKNKAYNYFEYVVLLCYLTGMAMLVGALCISLSQLTGSSIFNEVFPYLAILYSVWGIGQFFQAKDWWTYFMALMAYLTGFIFFMIAAIGTGLLLNVIIGN